ncbi:MAG: hypothetical protein HY557_01270 [Euryarchaeota archaeon]|nr:hypothetical protein [Euryarchaeota archaeon]
MVRTVGGREVESFALEVVPSTSCPVCANPGIPVTHLVMRAALPREFHREFAREGFLFCPTPSCPLAYFDNAESAYVHKDELRVLVGRKTAGPSAPVCYCLRVTEGQVMEEVAVKGCCRTMDEVAAATGALLGKACHIVNPSGKCCGDEVREAILKALRTAGFSDDAPEVLKLLEEDVDHCRSHCGLGEAD